MEKDPNEYPKPLFKDPGKDPKKDSKKEPAKTPKQERLEKKRVFQAAEEARLKKEAQDNLEEAIGKISTHSKSIDSELEQVIIIGTNIFKYAREVRKDPRLEREARRMLEFMASARNILRKFHGLRYMEENELEQYHKESSEFFAAKRVVMEKAAAYKRKRMA